MSMKNPLTPAEIEPATFWFVAQHLKRLDGRKENSFYFYSGKWRRRRMRGWKFVCHVVI